MLAKVLSSAIVGIDAHIVDVEVDIAAKGLPYFSIVGLPDTAVKESKDRVRAALKNIGYSFPLKQITINLAPADLKKEGSSFDLPIAVGILTCEGLIPSDGIDKYMIAGELSLDGTIKPVRGVLSMSMRSRQLQLKGIILPHENGSEAAVVKETTVYGMRNLSDLVNFFNGSSYESVQSPNLEEILYEFGDYEEDFSEVKGQEHAKRALEVAAAGAHNLIMIGPPGSGKTMLAKRIASILPPMTFEEAIETTKIYSAAGLLKNGAYIVSKRPFRSPHHTMSEIALVGGGQIPKPGEVSLSHNGVLFLDELPEFKRNVLETLRQPMENGDITVSRAAMSINFPASFIFVASLNPCPCGKYGDSKNICTCTPSQIHRYRSKLSGPLLDRIDIHIDVPSVDYKDLSSERCGESSKTIKERVSNARSIQNERFKNEKIYSNGQMKTRHIKKYCGFSKSAKSLLDLAMQKLGLSARAYSRIIKVARTIADLADSIEINEQHISEAIQYRTLDRDVL
ncbi:Mg chelatase subunit ChlI [Candidatus Magnetoovum chiemensis]|nr:Mg chelatase subunit ChlI [Candidatus Magnetoovum chiemensis]